MIVRGSEILFFCWSIKVLGDWGIGFTRDGIVRFEWLYDGMVSPSVDYEEGLRFLKLDELPSLFSKAGVLCAT